MEAEGALCALCTLCVLRFWGCAVRAALLGVRCELVLCARGPSHPCSQRSVRRGTPKGTLSPSKKNKSAPAQALGKAPTFGIRDNRSIKEQRESLPIFKLREQLVQAMDDNQVGGGGGWAEGAEGAGQRGHAAQLLFFSRTVRKKGIKTSTNVLLSLPSSRLGRRAGG